MSSTSLQATVDWQRGVRFERDSRLLAYAVLLALLVALLVCPLIMLAVGVLKTTSPLQGGGAFSFAAFPGMWQETNTSGALYNSSVYAVILGIAPPPGPPDLSGYDYVNLPPWMPTPLSRNASRKPRSRFSAPETDAVSLGAAPDCCKENQT